MATKSNDEDTLECFLYPKYCYTSPDTIDEKILNDEITKFNKVIEVYTKNYLWHRDSLIFHPRTKHAQLLEKVVHDGVVADDTSVVPHVYINLRYDEDIGDEWFIVFLIFKLTEAIDGLAARMTDSDGEFLLIEAADHLPSWANPETCHERVYILKGSIHIVNDKKLSSLERLRRLHEKPYNYCLSDAAQSIAKKKLSLYPDELIKRKHKARAYLPDKAALILQQKPDLISSIIRTTVHSDPLERKVCRAMRYFPPEQRKMININMTKCLYAMATSCKYTGDPRTGWNCPTTNNPQYNSHVLGIKIACGLEMLIAKANNNSNHKNGCEQNNDGIDDDKWKLYLNRLQVSGYFKGLLEGSQQRQRLVDTARDYLIKKPLEIAYQKNHDDNDTANVILNIWKNINTEDFEIQPTDEVSLSPPDDDSWINVDAAQLELMLGQHWGNISDKKNQQQQPQQQQEQQQESSSIKDKLNAFLNRTSDIDGVEYNNDNTRDDDDGKKIDFDPDEFDSALRGILDFTVPGNDDEFEGSSEGSLGGDDDDERYDEIDKLLHLELQMKLDKDSNNTNTIEKNLMESIEEEAGGAGPVGNILGGPVRKFMHLKLKSPTSVPPDLQS